MRLRATGGQSLNQRQNICAVLSIRRARSSGEPRPVELVEGDDRRPAACHLHGGGDEPGRCRRNPRWIPGPAGCADRRLQRHVPVGDLRTAPTSLSGRRGVCQRHGQAGPEEQPPEPHPLVGVVDPGRLSRLYAGGRRRGCARSGRRSRTECCQRDDDPDLCENELSHLTQNPKRRMLARKSDFVSKTGKNLPKAGYLARCPSACLVAGVSSEALEAPSVAFRATSTARLSRITVTLICPG